MKEIDLLELRKSLQMTQKEFAQFCGVTDRTVQKWESGATIPQIVRKLFRYIEAERNASTSACNKANTATSLSAGIADTNAATDTNEVVTRLIAELAAQRQSYTRQIDILLSLLSKQEEK